MRSLVVIVKKKKTRSIWQKFLRLAIFGTNFPNSKYFKGRNFRETEKSRNFADLSFATFTFWRKFTEETFAVFCECSILVAIIFGKIPFFAKLTFVNFLFNFLPDRNFREKMPKTRKTRKFLLLNTEWKGQKCSLIKCTVSTCSNYKSFFMIYIKKKYLVK